MVEGPARWRRCVEILTEMGEILTAHGDYGHAEVTAKLARLAVEDDDAFVKEIQSVSVWGGSGALWEVGGLGADKRRYSALVVALAGVMAKEDVETERARWVAETLSGWLAA